MLYWLVLVPVQQQLCSPQSRTVVKPLLSMPSRISVARAVTKDSDRLQDSNPQCTMHNAHQYSTEVACKLRCMQHQYRSAFAC